MLYCKCGKEIPEKRTALGFLTCLECGDQAALEEQRQKEKRVGIPVHKGAPEYLGSGEQFRKVMLEGGNRKTIPTPTSTVYNTPYIKVTSRHAEIPKRIAIGVYWIGQEKYVWYEGTDPRSKGATRWALYSNQKKMKEQTV